MSKTYREILSEVWEERARRNASYSLRSFARDLNISPQRLSGILNGKFGISPLAASKLAERLGWGSDLSARFVDSAASLHSRSFFARKVAREKCAAREEKRELLLLEEEKFRLAADWFHFALMELTELLPLRVTDARIVARRLGIPLVQAKAALNRLLKLGMLKEGTNKVLRRAGSFLANQAGNPSAAVREHHKQLLQMALVAVDAQSVNERVIRGLTLAVSAEEIRKIKTLIAELQHTIQSAQCSGEPKDAVYALTQQFFRLDVVTSSEPKSLSSAP